MKKIEYKKVGDYYLPDLELPKQKKGNLGKYGLLRLEYLKTQKKAFYTILKMQDKLTQHLEDVDFMANWYITNITTELAEREGVTEELKAANQMEWVGRMNNIKNRAEEVVLKEIIYDGGADNE